MGRASNDVPPSVSPRADEFEMEKLQPRYFSV